MMSGRDFMFSGCEVTSTDEQAEDSNDSIDLASLSPTLHRDRRSPMLDLNDLLNLSLPENLGKMEDDDYTEPDDDVLQAYLNDDVTLDADSAFPVARNLSPAPVDMASFIPVTPTGPPKQQSIRAGWEFDANVIIAVERATVRYWRSQKWLFVEPNTPFSVQFSLTPLEGSTEISEWFVRCTAVYTDPEYEHSVVRRCEKKTHNRLPKEGALGIVEVVEDEAWYCGSGARNSHYSVVLPLQAPSTTARYQMTCLRSCPHPGVDKRALALDFTVEDRSGAVYARDRILVRPCAKPKRDLKIEKRRLAKQNMEQARSAQPEEEPRCSKRRRVLTPPVEDQDAPVDCSENEDDSEMCLLRLKQAARYNRNQDIDQQIKSVIKNVLLNNNLE